jgi:hypothetical protein
MYMIDRENERVIPLREVHKHVPSRVPGKRVSPATVWRWAQRTNNPLETFRTPGGTFTSIEAIDRFIERCSNKAAAQAPAVAPAPTDKAKKAGEQLRKLIGKNKAA